VGFACRSFFAKPSSFTMLLCSCNGENHEVHICYLYASAHTCDHKWQCRSSIWPSFCRWRQPTLRCQPPRPNMPWEDLKSPSLDAVWELQKFSTRIHTKLDDIRSE
jgi:hypothetical protein